MDTVYYHDVISIVRDHQKPFKRGSSDIWKKIKDIKKNQNNNLKLVMETNDDFGVDIRLISGKIISITDMIRNITGYGDDKHAYSLLWYMFSDLENVKKNFRDSSVKSEKNEWISSVVGIFYGYNPIIKSHSPQQTMPGIFPQQAMSTTNQLAWLKNHVSGPLPEYYNFVLKTPMFFTIIKWGYTYDDTGGLIKYDMFEEIERALNISSIYSILSPGYHNFVRKATNSDLKIPSEIRNKMDLRVLFKWIRENKVTNKNIHRVLCIGTPTIRSDQKEILRYVKDVYPEISNYKWFMNIQKTIE